MNGKTREKYTEIDDRRIWRFLYKKIKKEGDKVVYTLGSKLWEEYVEENPASNRHSAHSLTSHMRRILRKNFHKAELPKKEYFYLIKRLKWPLSVDQKRFLQQRFSVLIDLNDDKSIKSVTYFDEDSLNAVDRLPRVHRVDSRQSPKVTDTEENEESILHDADVEIDEHSSISGDTDIVEIDESSTIVNSSTRQSRNDIMDVERDRVGTSRLARPPKIFDPNRSAPAHKRMLTTPATSKQLANRSIDTMLCVVGTYDVSVTERIQAQSTKKKPNNDVQAVEKTTDVIDLENGGTENGDVDVNEEIMTFQYIPEGRTLRFEKKTKELPTVWLGKGASGSGEVRTPARVEAQTNRLDAGSFEQEEEFSPPPPQPQPRHRGPISNIAQKVVRPTEERRKTHQRDLSTHVTPKRPRTETEASLRTLRSQVRESPTRSTASRSRQRTPATSKSRERPRSPIMTRQKTLANPLTPREQPRSRQPSLQRTPAMSTSRERREQQPIPPEQGQDQTPRTSRERPRTPTTSNESINRTSTPHRSISLVRRASEALPTPTRTREVLSGQSTLPPHPRPSAKTATTIQQNLQASVQAAEEPISTTTTTAQDTYQTPVNPLDQSLPENLDAPIAHSTPVARNAEGQSGAMGPLHSPTVEQSENDGKRSAFAQTEDEHGEPHTVALTDNQPTNQQLPNAPDPSRQEENIRYFQEHFLRPPQPTGETLDAMTMVYFRNMLRDNLRKRLWSDLPGLYEGIPEQYQEHLKTTKEFAWILKHAKKIEISSSKKPNAS